MNGYIVNIEQESRNNENFRKVLYTAKHSQLVLMSLLPKEEIGMEVHTLDQFIRVESGQGRAILDGKETTIEDGSAIVIPAGTQHNIVNDSETEEMKLYTIYSPAEHRDQVIHATKADAMTDVTDEFDGKTTE
jgi:mannose-6-phosphate isomerase-like protein (cupin superfamily)